MASQTSPQAQLTLDQQTTELPIYQPTLGKQVVDIQALQDAYTLDEGLRATAFCRSDITFIDGEKGILLHRGYPIDQLAEHCSYLDLCHLLLEGSLPDAQHSPAFQTNIMQRADIPESIQQLLKNFNQQAHPMAMLISCLGALAAEYPQPSNPEELASYRKHAALDLIAKMPTLVAMCYRRRQGKAFLANKPTLSYAEHFLHMLFAEDEQAPAPDPVLIQAMDHIFSLHADHEQNASTATVRLAGSTDANPFACIAAGLAALWGAKHGGANEAALRMLQEIGEPSQIAKYLAKAKDHDDPFRLMGFGHRVYKNYDPRAKVMQKTCHQVLQATGRGDDPLFKLAVELEKLAGEDPYFVERKLYPNIDFYSGITLNAMGIPTELFTAIFGLARCVGWISHFIEMHDDPRQGLIRPRQLYTGPTQRELET